jgi:serine/threonine protein kinase
LAGLVHRDLKPENVIVARDGRVKILDFGLARHTAAPAAAPEATRTLVAAATQPGMILGTVNYMSREQVRGRPADHRSDIFSPGTVLHEMISGAQPFRGESSVETMNAVLKEDPPALPETTSSALAQIVSRCLEKDPARRFQNASDLAFALRSATGGSQSSARPFAPPGTRPRWLLPGALGVAGALLGAAAAFLVSPHTPPSPRTARFVLSLPPGDELSIAGRRLALSPDGAHVVYGARRGACWIPRFRTARGAFRPTANGCLLVA